MPPFIDFTTHSQRKLTTMTKEKRDELWKTIEATQGAIAAEIRRMLNEPPFDASNLTPENTRRRIAAMIECAADATSDEERHTAWIRMHESAGWTYGDKFDSVLKTHPNMVPWEQLPKTVQSKARIFDIMAKLGKSLESLLTPPAESEIPQIPPDIE